MPPIYLDHLEVPCTPADLHAIRAGRTEVLERVVLAALRAFFARITEVPGATGP
ncbi:hypothetical protein [Catenuloplanes japonicus]|uniref:hypothetical protein n=1 Tax=Catenuloplanes japonicus TaxID=33876 RepID=UPI000A6C361B|nr:hypothetical protein [Catenuloplanes japonicus]